AVQVVAAVGEVGEVLAQLAEGEGEGEDARHILAGHGAGYSGLPELSHRSVGGAEGGQDRLQRRRIGAGGEGLGQRGEAFAQRRGEALERRPQALGGWSGKRSQGR